MILQILLIIVIIGCVLFGIYLRRRLNARSHSKLNVVNLATVEIEEYISNAENIYTPKSSHHIHFKNKVHLKHEQYNYVCESPYSDYLSGCSK
jgi:hypothetical protein